MRTIKRNVNPVNTSLSSYNKSIKYFNQLEWRGIVENKNIFDVDQLSQQDAKNVYVDTHGSLVSRKPLIEEELPTNILPNGYRLIDVITYGKVKIYVVKEAGDDGLLIRVSAAIDNNVYTLSQLFEYHISTIDNYIICFNDMGAKVFDINTASSGWQDFSKFVEIPVIKRIVGTSETKYPKNQFTSQYKEEYIWSNNSKAELPQNKQADVIVNSEVGSEDWRLDNANQLTDFRILKQVNYEYTPGDMISVAKNIICVAKKDSVLISRDNGDTFSREWYPVHGTFLEIASISDDGTSFFFVASDAVYRLDLGSMTWTAIYVYNDSTKSIGTNWTTVNAGYYGTQLKPNQKLWHFATKDMFAFMLWTSPTSQFRGELPILWFMGPGIVGRSEIPYDTFNTDAYIAPTFTDTWTKINESYRGTLGCSVAFCREAFDARTFTKGGPFEIGEPYGVDYSIGESTTMTYPTYLKIFLDEGYVKTNQVYSSGTVSEGNTVYRSFASILCGTTADRSASGVTIAEATYLAILPGYYCSTYKEGSEVFTVPLDINQPYCRYTVDSDYKLIFIPPIAGYIGNDTTTKATDLIYTQYLFVKASSPDGFTQDSPFNKLRIENIKTINSSKEGNGSLYNIQGKIYNAEESEKEGWYSFNWKLGRPPTLTNTATRQDTLINELELSNQMLTTAVPIQLTNSVGIIQHNLFQYINNTINYLSITVTNWTDYDPSPWTPRSSSVTILPNNEFYYVIMQNGKIFTNQLNNSDNAQIIYTYGTANPYTTIPNVSYSNTELYLGFDNKLSITANTRNDDGQILFNLPEINNQTFIENISNLQNISTTEVAIFFEDKIIICSKVEDQTLGYRYDYYPTKLSTGTRLGDSVINTIEGTYTIFPTKRGLAFMNYQAFMATTDQVLTYISDNIEDIYTNFYNNSTYIKILQRRTRLYLVNNTGTILVYDLSRNAWWVWEVPVNISKLITDQVELQAISDKLCIFRDHPTYKDFPLTNKEKRIEWFIVSQPLHMKAPNYYKNLKQLVFQFLDEVLDNKEHSITVQIQCYRKKLSTKEPELITFKIDELRTFVKRFNYWKINEIQYALADDFETVIPTRLRLNGVSVKYELGEEVR